MTPNTNIPNSNSHALNTVNSNEDLQLHHNSSINSIIYLDQKKVKQLQQQTEILN